MIDPLTLIGTIPTALNTVQSLGSLFQQPYSPPKQYQENSREVFKKGGSIRGHNKYNAPAHEQGGQLVNDQGIPDPNGTNEIETKESKYTYTRLNKENPTYIFTPEDSQKVSELTKKYKNSNTSDLEKNALELSIQRIENKNEMKKKQQFKQYSKGGVIKKYFMGGSPTDPINPIRLNPALNNNSSLRDAFRFGEFNNVLNLVGQEAVDNQLLSGNSSTFKPFLQDKLNSQYYDKRRQEGIAKTARFNRAQTNRGMAVDTINPSQSSTTNKLNKLTPEPSGDQLNRVNNFYSSNSSVPQTNNPLKTLDTLRNLTLAGSSLGMLKRAEREDPIMTDYSKARTELNKLDSNLDPMREQVAQSSNQMRAVNRNSASSYNSFANREAQRVANLQQSLSGVTLQERQLANGIAGQRAQFESGVAQDNKQTLQQNRINNQQNQAAKDMNNERQLQTVMSDLDRRSRRENNKNLADATREETITLMSTMYDNFDPSKPYYSALINKSMGKTLTAEEKEILLSGDPINFK